MREPIKIEQKLEIKIRTLAMATNKDPDFLLNTLITLGLGVMMLNDTELKTFKDIIETKI